MSHENGGWMNDDQRSEMKERARVVVADRAVSLRRAVQYGLTNGKKNLVVDLDLLDLILRGEVPVGGNELPPEDVTALLYEMKAQRDKALTHMTRPASAVAREIAARVWCDQEMGSIAMDVDAAEAIARIVDAVRRDQTDRQSYDDLRASGGIVNAP